MSAKKHWQAVYEAHAENQVSWFQELPELSLRLIKSTGAALDTRFIDIGGGASRLVDNLLVDGYTGLAVLDIAESGLLKARERLGEREGEVEWIVCDVCDYEPAHRWYVWHDRAVFHFLTERKQRGSYRRALGRSMHTGGHVIIATFGPDGPEKCSGLPVVRYSADRLSKELGDECALLRTEIEQHRTPSGSVQEFLYCHFRFEA